MIVSGFQVETVQTPLHGPFVTSRGSRLASRSVAVTLDLDDGFAARGECVPVTYVTGETIESVCADLERVGPQLIGLDAGAYRSSFARFAELLPASHSARCALEMAALAGWSHALGAPLHLLFGGALDAVETDITIPIVDNAAELASQAWEQGIRIFKLKVGDSDPEADLARLRAIAGVAPAARIRLDANQAFDAEGALDFVGRALAEGAQIELLEQPVPRDDFEALGRVAERSPVPVIADESVRTPHDAITLAATTPVHGFNVKINKNGISGALDIIAVAR